MKLAGFKLSRFRQWSEVVLLEGRQLTWSARLRLARRLILAALKMGDTVDRKTWRKRIRVCRNCPVFNREFRTCRPHFESTLGCSCWVPLLATMREPYKGGCWAKENLPNTGLGWD